MTWITDRVDQDRPDPEFDAMTSRLLRREALRRAAEELNTTSGPGLEDVLARISAEVTAEAASRVSATDAGSDAGPTVPRWDGPAYISPLSRDRPPSARRSSVSGYAYAEIQTPETIILNPAVG